LAQRHEQEAAAARRVDNLPAADAADAADASPVVEEAEPAWAPPPRPERWPAGEPEEPVAATPRHGVPEPEYQYPPEAYDDIPYAEPEDAYTYPYQADDRRRGGGGNALPIIGFVALCVLALAVGAVLAGLLGSDDGVADASPLASAEASGEPSAEASVEPSGEASSPAGEATPPPSGGPVTFPDGGLLTIQPCATRGFRDEAVGRPEEMACRVDGSTVDGGDLTAIIVFSGIDGSDTLAVLLRSNGETINEQERVLSSVVSCGEGCNGLIYGAAYQGLEPGSYELVLNRNGEFADSAEFVVEG
jgi:hypothetical protein